MKWKVIECRSDYRSNQAYYSLWFSSENLLYSYRMMKHPPRKRLSMKFLNDWAKTRLQSFNNYTDYWEEKIKEYEVESNRV